VPEDVEEFTPEMMKDSLSEQLDLKLEALTPKAVADALDERIFHFLSAPWLPCGWLHRRGRPRLRDGEQRPFILRLAKLRRIGKQRRTLQHLVFRYQERR
jgi:hypothetical protein